MVQVVAPVAAVICSASELEMHFFLATDNARGKGLTLLRGVGGGVWPFFLSAF